MERSAGLTESVYKVVLQKLILAQIREPILYFSKNKGRVDRFVWELTFAEQLHEYVPRDKCKGATGEEVSGFGSRVED